VNSWRPTNSRHNPILNPSSFSEGVIIRCGEPARTDRLTFNTKRGLLLGL
jgi:hypothetical protein